MIRANRVRKAAGPSSTVPAPVAPTTTVASGPIDSLQPSVVAVSAEDAQLGDEYISLTFNESESDGESEEEDSEEEEGSEEEDESADVDHRDSAD